MTMYNFQLQFDQEKLKSLKTSQLLISTKVDVGRVDANVHPEMSLLEHILLKMDFNYLDTVRLNIANGGSS